MGGACAGVQTGMIRHHLPLACEVVPSPGVLRGFGRRLHRSLTIWIGKKPVLKLTGSIESTRGAGGRRKTGGGKGARRKEGEGRREEWREEGGERRKEEGRFQTVQSAYLPFQPFAFSSVDNHVGFCSGVIEETPDRQN